MCDFIFLVITSDENEKLAKFIQSQIPTMYYCQLKNVPLFTFQDLVNNLKLRVI